MTRLLLCIFSAWRYLSNRIFKVLRRITSKPIKKLLLAILILGSRKTILANQKILQQILRETYPEKSRRAVIIFPPGLDWDVKLFQCPQQLAIALARRGTLVIYIQPNCDKKKESFRLIEKRLHLCTAHAVTFRDPIQPLIYLLTWNRGDGYTDRTAEVAEVLLKQGERSYRLIRQEYAGDHWALNRGTSLANGEYIVIPKFERPLSAWTFVNALQLAGGIWKKVCLFEGDAYRSDRFSPCLSVSLRRAHS